jgi:hypothetical protein
MDRVHIASGSFHYNPIKEAVYEIVHQSMSGVEEIF